MRIGVVWQAAGGLLISAMTAVGAVQQVEVSGVLPLYSPSNPNQVIQVTGPGATLQLGDFIPRLGLYAVQLGSQPALAAATGLKTTPRTTFEAGRTSQAEAFGQQSATYVAYLPSSYRAESPPPLIFAFSPVGDAGRIVEVLRPVAEERGWVVVGCNGPRDGRDENFYPTVREIVLDVRRRIPHDGNREYLCGFSGGAMASYRLSRIYWDEFAGVLAFGGWLGIYEEDLPYPSRLSAALVNGRQDEGANQYEKRDRKILQRSGIRSKVFRFEGGHQYPDAQTVLEAAGWLEEDWQGNGRRLVASPQEASAQAALLLEICRSEDLDPCAQAALAFLLQNPQSPAADAARFLLARAFAAFADPEKAAFSIPSELSAKGAAILYGMFQGLSEINRPLAWSLLETAHRLAPKQARIGARLSLFVLQSQEPSVHNPDRALRLALQATQSGSNEWTAWFARGLSEGRLGRTQDARKSLKKAYQLAPNWAQRMCRQALLSLGGGN